MAPFSHDPAGFHPRGRKHDKPGGSRFRLGSPLLYLGLVVLGLFLFRNLFQEAGFLRVPCSEFKQATRENRFQRVQITPATVRGFTSGRAGAPVRPGDASSMPWFRTSSSPRCWR